MPDYTVELRGHVLEYVDETHTYLVDGVIVPSITSLCKRRLGDRYPNVPRTVLKRAADRGTAIHGAIENYCKTGQIFGEYADEVFNFRTVERTYGITVKANEVPVILFDSENPIAAGRLDLVIERGGRKGIADIKTTAKLDKDYLAVQLNLYARAYEQCYGEHIETLAGVHIRKDKGNLCSIPINMEYVEELMKELRRDDKHDDGQTPGSLL